MERMGALTAWVRRFVALIKVDFGEKIIATLRKTKAKINDLEASVKFGSIYYSNLWSIGGIGQISNLSRTLKLFLVR
jgi:hypothetical protein